MIEVSPYNTSFLKVRGSVAEESALSDYFSFFVDGYRWMPPYKSGRWDGKIRLYNRQTKLFPYGLLWTMRNWAIRNEIDLDIDSKVSFKNHIIAADPTQFIQDLNCSLNGQSITPMEHQERGFRKAIETDRIILESPTSSGKSLMIYMLLKWYEKRQCLLVVPTISLVDQMYSDFEDYSTLNGWSVEDNVQKLYGGESREFDKRIIISTWQSINAMKRLDKKSFKSLRDRTQVMIMDECHVYKSAEVKEAMEAFTTTPIRIGTTGTIANTYINKLQLIGLIGPDYKVISTNDLIKLGLISPVEIDVIILDHPQHERIKRSYQDEVKYLSTSEIRNSFIRDLALNTKGNTLILFDRVQDQGKPLNEMIDAANAGRKRIYFIHGGVDSERREYIRKVVADIDNAVIIATSSLFATGTNIPSLQNVIFAASSKSSIKIRQSIGRGLRKAKNKQLAKIFDISDDLSWGKTKRSKNFGIKHLEERLKIYDQESFPYKKIRIPLVRESSIFD